jgi:hypothetical protein
MPVIEGTQRLKTAEAEYDFAVDGGAVSTITLRGVGVHGNAIPAGAVVTGGYIDVETAVLPTTVTTVALNAEAAGDLRVAAVASDLTVGRKDIVPDSTGSTAVKTTASRSLAMAIAAGTVTAGKFRVVVFYK